jgi:hypothetical protein
MKTVATTITAKLRVASLAGSADAECSPAFPANGRHPAAGYELCHLQIHSLQQITWFHH